MSEAIPWIIAAAAITGGALAYAFLIAGGGRHNGPKR